jgi:hypothetical protein
VIANAQLKVTKRVFKQALDKKTWQIFRTKKVQNFQININVLVRVAIKAILE